MKILTKIVSGMILFSMFTISCSKKTTPTASNAAAITETAVQKTTDLSVEGKKVFEAKCGRCHGLKDPAEFTSQEWRPIMNSMADKAKLTADEKLATLTYVMKYAKTGK